MLIDDDIPDVSVKMRASETGSKSLWEDTADIVKPHRCSVIRGWFSKTWGCRFYLFSMGMNKKMIFSHQDTGVIR